MSKSRNAIALLVTVMFVMVISVAIAYGLQQVNSATKLVKKENSLYQMNMLVEDILNILQNSQELHSSVENNASSDFYAFLSQASFIPIEYEGISVVLKLRSARRGFNPASLNSTTSVYLKEYLGKYGITSRYVDILLDNVGGIKKDNSYNSTIFDENPYLFRDYIASAKHLRTINIYYTKEYNDNALENIDFKKLFYYGADKNTSIDLNYASTELWEFMLGCSKERAELLSSRGGFYTSYKDLDINDAEQKILKRDFKTSFLEPVIEVEVMITLNGTNSKVYFEYDIKKKRGSNFVYEI